MLYLLDRDILDNIISLIKDNINILLISKEIYELTIKYKIILLDFNENTNSISKNLLKKKL